MLMVIIIIISLNFYPVNDSMDEDEKYCIIQIPMSTKKIITLLKNY